MKLLKLTKVNSPYSQKTDDRYTPIYLNIDKIVRVTLGDNLDTGFCFVKDVNGDSYIIKEGIGYILGAIEESR